MNDPTSYLYLKHNLHHPVEENNEKTIDRKRSLKREQDEEEDEEIRSLLNLKSSSAIKKSKRKLSETIHFSYDVYWEESDQDWSNRFEMVEMR